MAPQNPLASSQSGSGDDQDAISPALVARTVDVRTLVEGEICELYSLMEKSYESISYDRFRADLGNKNSVILLRCREGLLRGFSTLAVYPVEHGGEMRQIVFSGDTVIDEEFRGEQALAIEWIRFVARVKAAHPTRPLYWFLIVKGEKTYRFLPTFFDEFYPSRRRETPADTREFMNTLAAARFGQFYDPSAGVIRFPSSLGHLKSSEVEPSPKVLKHPEIQYFFQINPGYDRGEELVCLTELRAENFRSFARKIFEKTFQSATEDCPQ